MARLRLTILFAVWLVACAPRLAGAQTAPDPSGHWEGALDAPKGAVAFVIDLGKSAEGAFKAAFSQPADHIRGLPLAGVTVEGATVRLVLKAGSGGGTFEGVVSADGQAMTGTFNAKTEQGVFPVPFNATRTGDARFEALPKNAAVAKEMEGAWSGVIDAGGRQIHMVLKLANQPDGTCAASLVSVDEGGMEMPVGVEQRGARLIVDTRVTDATYSATLSADGTELAGTWAEGPAKLPLTLRKNK